jgi:predicted RNase H-like HicB family nuclease
VTEIIFIVERCEESGWLCASWDAPGAGGGIVTQGKDLDELQAMIKEAVHCHLDGQKDEPTRFVTVLEMPPVESPQTAVKVAIAAEVKKGRKHDAQ